MTQAIFFLPFILYWSRKKIPRMGKPLLHPALLETTNKQPEKKGRESYGEKNRLIPNWLLKGHFSINGEKNYIIHYKMHKMNNINLASLHLSLSDIKTSGITRTPDKPPPFPPSCLLSCFICLMVALTVLDEDHCERHHKH